MPTQVNIPLRAIQHLGIPVSDIEVSKSFYELLGFSNVMQASFDHENKQGTCIMMQRDNMIIELYQFPAASAALAEIKGRSNGHIDHVAFDVPDIDEAFTILKKAGFNVMEEAPVFLQFWQNGCKYFNITGPDGERLEFNQVL